MHWMKWRIPLALTSRWTELRKHHEQLRYWNTLTRFNTVPAGRRSGKTELAKRKLVKRALRGTKYDNPRFFAAAPTYQQAKRIYWQDLKAMIPNWLKKGAPSESELVIRLKNGVDIYVVGMDKPERIEGQPWDGGILDEYGNMKAEAWGANVRPALSDRGGWCDLIGVPEGRNHYYDTDKKAKADTTGTWGAFHWVSADILDPKEIMLAREDLDDLTFKQEYEASFINFEGRAYYPFEELLHTTDELYYDPNATLIFTFDFNVDPGTAAVIQEQELPNGVYGSGIIGEVYIPRNSNTPAVCRKLIEDWGDHQGKIYCYGDATGGARGSAKVKGSDWDLIKGELNGHFGDNRMFYRVKSKNPSERSRINAVNSRLLSTSGIIRLMVEPSMAPNVVRDFEGVKLLEGGSGEIDKKHDPKLTHLTDGIGYYIEHKYPIVRDKAKTSKVQGF